MKKRRIIIAAIIVIFIIVLATVIIKVWPKSNKREEVKVINTIEKYGYTLDDNETNLHQKYFNELVAALKEDEVDEESYASVVVKLFVSDFYNLDNKTTKNDIGGIQYVYSAAKDNMVLKAKDTIYKYVESNVDNTRNQTLPIVSGVEIVSVDKTEFEYGDETDEEAYEVSVKWSYKEDLKYQDEATIILIHEDNKLSIAEIE